MREMKDSGVEWLGAVPASWEVKKLKYALVRNDGGVWGDDPKEDAENCVVLRSTEQTIDGLWDIKSPAERYLGSLASIQRCRLEPNDLLITKSSGSSDHIGKTTLFEADTYDKPCWYSNFMQRLTPSKTVEPKYLWYVLNSSFVREQFVYLQESSISMGNLTKSIIDSVVLALPPSHEQRGIVSYLDERCAAIGEDVAKRREVIGKLKEYKKSLIAHAVTKGLDPAAEMKDSGVEWIGEIPGNWTVVRTKSCLRFSRAKKPENREVQVLSLYREYGVIPKLSRDDNHNRTSEDTSDYKHVHPGDLVVNKMKAWQGSLGLSGYEGIVSPAYFVYSPNENTINRRYLHYLVRSSLYAQRWNALSYGIREGQWDLHREDFESNYLILPPMSTQCSIADYLDERCAAIDEAITRQEQLIDKLGEYRKSIIHHAVTGKIDCTEA